MVFDHFIYAIRLVNWVWATKLRLGSEREYIKKYYDLIDHQILMNRRKDQKQGIWLIWKALRAGYRKTAKKSWTLKSVWMRGGHPTREQLVLAVGKRLLSHIKLLGPRQRINIQLEENQKAINPQRLQTQRKHNRSRRAEKAKRSNLKQSVERLGISPNVLHAVCKQYPYNLHSE
jgi:hypothetical protein